MKKILLSTILISSFAFSAPKMFEPEVSTKVSIHPEAGGIEGIAPVYGALEPSPTLSFEWRGKNILGDKPAFIIFEAGGFHHQPYFVGRDAKRISFETKELGLQRGKEYRWYLGRLEKKELIAQSRVFTFRILSEKESKNLARELVEAKAGFSKALVYYKYQMYHSTVDSLKVLYRERPTSDIKRLLYLGYVKLGRPREAKKYEAKN